MLRKLRIYRLTILFTAAAFVAIAGAALVVSNLIGDLARNNLASISEENASRDALQIESILTDPDSVFGSRHHRHEPSDGSDGPPLTLDSLTGPDGLPSHFQELTRGAAIVELQILDLTGSTVWSNIESRIGKKSDGDRSLIQRALSTGVGSRLSFDETLDFGDGTKRSLDLVESYVPLRLPDTGQVIGILNISSDISRVVNLQVQEAKATARWVAVGTMAGLFVILLGFIMAADVAIGRARKREVLAVQEANRSLESQIQQRTQDLENANRALTDAQDQVVRSAKLAAIGQLAGGIAHDLRNPLGSIKNSVYILIRTLNSDTGTDSKSKMIRSAQRIDEQVIRAERTVGNLMNYARVGDLLSEPVDRNKLVEDALSGLGEKADVDIVRQLDPEMPMVVGDSDKLNRVMSNLVNNACEAMPNGGGLTVGTGTEDGFAILTVRDNGVGISDADLGKVFEPLFTKKAGGTGFGLAVCQEIVHLHGGSIGVARNSTDAEGSTFTVKLPLPAHSASTLP